MPRKPRAKHAKTGISRPADESLGETGAGEQDSFVNFSLPHSVSRQTLAAGECVLYYSSQPK